LTPQSPVHVRDREFNGQLLLDAGSPLEWEASQPKPAEGISEIVTAWQRG
jgi:hypothetical protein